MNTLDEMIEVLNAYKEGNAVERKRNEANLSEWGEVSNHKFDFGRAEYRIKPEIQTAKCWEDLKVSDVWATGQQAEACTALRKLSQLMKQVNGDWKPSYTNGFLNYQIICQSDTLTLAHSVSVSHFLTFKEAKTRDTFLENHRALIEQAKPLL